jgi:hypothetical protein
MRNWVLPYEQKVSLGTSPTLTAYEATGSVPGPVTYCRISSQRWGLWQQPDNGFVMDKQTAGEATGKEYDSGPAQNRRTSCPSTQRHDRIWHTHSMKPEWRQDPLVALPRVCKYSGGRSPALTQCAVPLAGAWRGSTLVPSGGNAHFHSCPSR